MPEVLAAAAETLVIAQIEDPEAVEVVKRSPQPPESTRFSWGLPT
jgi:hypothetical protein